MKNLQKHGFIVGKFMPLHRGHMYVIDTALTQCDALTIMLFCHGGDPIPCLIREKWLRETYPEATIITNTDALPRDDSGVEHWNVWMESIKNQLEDSAIDVVFSSETYGERLAAELSAKHVTVDTERSTVPVSGTEIRSNPQKYMEYLPECVRAYYKH